MTFSNKKDLSTTNHISSHLPRIQITKVNKLGLRGGDITIIPTTYKTTALKKFLGRSAYQTQLARIKLFFSILYCNIFASSFSSRAVFNVLIKQKGAHERQIMQKQIELNKKLIQI